VSRCVQTALQPSNHYKRFCRNAAPTCSSEVLRFVPFACVVSGERKQDDLDDKDALNRRERFVGKFKRTIALPEDVDPDQTEAIYRDGVLHISVAKKEEVQPRQIKVKV